MSSSPKSTTQTTRPFPMQEQALTRLFDRAEAAFGVGPQQFFPGDTVAAQSDNTIAGQQLALDAVAPSASMGMNSAAAINMALDPNSAQSQALISPFIANLQENILPSIGSQAIQQGAFGGDRQRIQEQRAAEGVAGQATEAILQNQLRAIGALPTVNNALVQPAEIASRVGAQQEAREQALINAEIQRFNFNQEAPQSALDRLASRIAGTNIGTQTIQTNGGGGNPIATAAGLGLVARGMA